MNFDRKGESLRNRNRKSDLVEHGFTLSAMFDDIIVGGFSKPSFSTTGVSTPAVNIIETNDDFHLEMVAPGMKKENFNVALQDNVLTISYEHGDNRDGVRRGWKYTTREYNYHSFARSFLLPDLVEIEKIRARYEDGILTLILPKNDDAKGKLARQIQVL
jgi:HSP20 family protein